jgi:hypothetical protein
MPRRIAGAKKAKRQHAGDSSAKPPNDLDMMRPAAPALLQHFVVKCGPRG